jgi:TATA-box binding protein (TBP) (component of TFIID and TFIIIB)
VASAYPEGSPDGILTRFTAPANHMVINKSGKTLVAGSRLLRFVLGFIWVVILYYAQQ